VLLLPGAIDNNIVRQASRAGFGRLFDAGVEIFEYQPGLLHAKTMAVDGIWATVGSANVDNRSFALNEELNVALYDSGMAARLEKIFLEDVAHSRRVEEKRWRSRGPVARATGGCPTWCRPSGTPRASTRFVPRPPPRVAS